MTEEKRNGQNRKSTIIGTAPSSTLDLEDIFEIVKGQISDVRWKQLSAWLPSDDDGIWFFLIEGKPGDVQIESSNGKCPFLVETDKLDERFDGNTPEEIAAKVIEWLLLPGGREENPWYPRA